MYSWYHELLLSSNSDLNFLLSVVTRAITLQIHCKKLLSICTPAGNTGMSSTVLWASVLHQDSRQAIVWRPEANSARGWREDTIFLGRIPETFQVHFHSQRSEGRLGDVALDQLEFLDCALPCESLISKSCMDSIYSKQ